MRSRINLKRTNLSSLQAMEKFIDAELRLVAEDSLKVAREIAQKEREKRAVELSETLMTEVLLEELEELVEEELNRAIEER